MFLLRKSRGKIFTVPPPTLCTLGYLPQVVSRQFLLSVLNFRPDRGIILRWKDVTLLLLLFILFSGHRGFPSSFGLSLFSISPSETEIGSFLKI